MKSHGEIDRRSMELARAIVEIIDSDPERKGLQKARQNCDRWLGACTTPVLHEWKALLSGDWSVIRAVLLDEGEEGRRLRQSSPFCGVLSTTRRWAIYRQHNHEPKAA